MTLPFLAAAGDHSFLFLILSLLVLGIGPVIYEFTRQARAALGALDGFVLVTVGGLVILWVLPHSFSAGGLPAILVAIAGFSLPFFVERLGERATIAGHKYLALIAIFGLIPHALLDGAALCAGACEDAAHSHSHAHAAALPFAVVLHRLPVGFAIWWLVRPSQGRGRAALCLLLIIVPTIAGYILGQTHLHALDHSSFAVLEALVGGMLLHIFLHKPHGKPAGEGPPPRWKLSEAAGALLGISMFLVLPGLHEHAAHEDGFSHAYAHSFLQLGLASAPALVLGFLAAGLISVFLSDRSVSWLNRGRPWSQSLRGTLYGLPLPICCCGVVPIYHSLVLRGVALTTAMALLIATPGLGVTSILLSIPLLGWKLTAARIACATLVAVAVSQIVGRIARIQPPLDSAPSASPEVEPSLSRRIRRALGIGFGDVVEETGPWLLAGLAVAAAIAPLPEDSIGGWLSAIPAGLDIPLLALAGIPVYICASGATPLAAVLIWKGLSPGAAIAFLITGPATNVTTFGLLTRLHGRRIAMLFTAGVMVAAVALGYAVNWALSPYRPPLGWTEEAEHIGTLHWIGLTILGAVLIISIARLGPRGFLGKLFSAQDGESTGARPPRDHHHH